MILILSGDLESSVSLLAYSMQITWFSLIVSSLTAAGSDEKSSLSQGEVVFFALDRLQAHVAFPRVRLFSFLTNDVLLRVTLLRM